MKSVVILLFLASCASRPEKATTHAPEKVSNEKFRKEKALSNNQVPDFYPSTAKSLTPALQDETLDRLSPSDLGNLDLGGDPLAELAVHCSKRDFKKAFELAGAAFNKYQKVAAYWNQIANCHLSSGSYRKALLFYNKALEVTPNYVPALNNIGVLYSRQGQDQKALVAFDRASKAGKFSNTPRYNLAKLYLTYGLAEEALPIFQGLLSQAESDVDLLNSVASSLFLLSDYQKAWTYYQQIPRSEWKRAEIGINLALTMKKIGQDREGEKIFRQIDVPANGNLRKYYSNVLAQLGGAE